MNEYELLTRVLSPAHKADNQRVMIENKPAKPQRAKVSDKGINAYTLYRYDPDTENFLPFFNNTHGDDAECPTPEGLRQFCDYILLASKGDKLYIILVEMKSGDASGAHEQLEATETFIEYVRMSARRISRRNGYDHFNAGNIQVRKVLLRPQPPSRPQTNARRNAQNDFATNPIVLRGDTLNIAYVCNGR